MSGGSRDSGSRHVMRAIFDGDIPSLDALVRQGFDIDIVTEEDGWNLLHRALVSVSVPPVLEMVQHLIECGVDVKGVDRFGNSPLHYAARWKDTDLIESLVGAGADIDLVNRDGLTPLRMTLLSKPINLEAVEVLLSHGADVDQPLPGGRTDREYARIISHGEQRELIKLIDRYPRQNDAQ